jgi:hypothetical protein
MIICHCVGILQVSLVDIDLKKIYIIQINLFYKVERKYNIFYKKVFKKM